MVYNPYGGICELPDEYNAIDANMDNLVLFGLVRQDDTDVQANAFDHEDSDEQNVVAGQEVLLTEPPDETQAQDDKKNVLQVLADQSTTNKLNTLEILTTTDVIAHITHYCQELCAVTEEKNNQRSDSSTGYKTRLQAETVYPMLLRIQMDKNFLLTHHHYGGGLDFFENTYAYLKMIPAEAKVEIKDGILYVDGKAVDSVKYMDHVSDKVINDIDKPLVQALFGLVWMKLEPLLNDICLPGGIYDKGFQKKLSDIGYKPLSERYAIDRMYGIQENNGALSNMSVDDLHKIDMRDLYEMYYKDLLDYTVVVHMRDLMRYLGYGSSPSNEQMEAVRGRMQALSRVIGVLRYDAGKTYMSAEHLLMDYGFDPDNNVVFVHSPYMNKLVELISRDRIQRFYTTRVSGK